MSDERGPAAAPPVLASGALSDEQLRAFELLPDAVVVVGRDGRVRSANTLAARLLRRPVDELVGLPAGEVLRLSDPKGQDWWPWLGSSDADPRLHPRVPPTDLLLSTHDGRSRPVSVTAARLADADGELAAIVVVMRRGERRAYTDAAESDLVSTVSHELRAPLTSVKGFTRTLIAKWDRFTDEQKLTMLRTINEDADRVTRLLGDLLDVSRIDAGRLRLHRQMVDIGEILDRVVSRVEAGENAGRLTTTVDPDVPRLYADPDKVEQVLTNLIENACKYSDGPITVHVRVVADEARVTVADQGPGIPEEHRALVFARFFRSPSERRHGTGLGLYITKGLVEAHGGRIWVDGKPGEGAAFHFTLPLGGLELAGIDLDELRSDTRKP
ncbi:MAG TPA: PAS domain-containing sensor histidine kinase [Egibacteraceae bacterium]